MDALEKYGKDWEKIQKKIKTRTLPQIRSHAQKMFAYMTDHDVDALIDKKDEVIVTKSKSTRITEREKKMSDELHQKKNNNSAERQTQDSIKRKVYDQN